MHAKAICLPASLPAWRSPIANAICPYSQPVYLQLGLNSLLNGAASGRCLQLLDMAHHRHVRYHPTVVSLLPTCESLAEASAQAMSFLQPHRMVLHLQHNLPCCATLHAHACRSWLLWRGSLRALRPSLEYGWQVA